MCLPGSAFPRLPKHSQAHNCKQLVVAGHHMWIKDVDKGSEWILSVARHRDPIADPVGMMINAEIDLDS